jgi:hypothetical protein
LFRIFEFNRCFRDGNFPCRWAPDSGKGYGEPLFNFYAQLPYSLTEKFIILGFSLLDSAKIVYILSLVLSGFAMFVYARRVWGQLGGLISAVFYVYAPYRAVDVWVRGALPEALAFILYPLILLFLDRYLESKKLSLLLCFSLALALLINIHNLSFLMFVPFLGIYWLVKSLAHNHLSSFWALTMAGIFSVLLSAFYLLPVIFESSLVTLGQTVKDYYDFHIHFTTLRELFVSRFWGYGASLWAQKFLSVSVGHLHWLIPVFLSIYILMRKKLNQITGYCLLFTVLGFLALFLTHGKSSFIWNLIPVMKYIQFPWRFLSIAVLFLSLASGYCVHLFSQKLAPLLLVLLLLLNYGFFRPDIWRDISDSEQFSGSLWDEARSSSLTDFWPKVGIPPVNFAPANPEFSLGEGSAIISQKWSQASRYLIKVDSPLALIKLPQVYFPGWIVSESGKIIPASTDSLGRISVNLPSGEHDLYLKFVNTPIRSLGNYISLLALFSLPLWFLKKSLG